MKIPSPDTIRVSAVTHLRELGFDEESDILSRCKLEISDKGQRYTGTTAIGLNITLRCKALDLSKFNEHDTDWELPSSTYIEIKGALEAVLPAQFKVHDLSARSLLVDREEFEKTELEQLIESQIDLLIAVATGGPSIQSKNQEYRERRKLISDKIQTLSKKDPNPFVDLWAWYGRWSSGDLPSYKSRREYIRNIYRPLLEELAGFPDMKSSAPIHEPTGWAKVDRTVDKIITTLAEAKVEEDFQAVGLLCRECLISLAQAVYNPKAHKSIDGTEPSKTDAYRMLETYFSSEFPGSEYEALRRHAKASLSLANELQHKRTAKYKDAALCSEATRTVVNIVAITSDKR
jgi:hypothetical protein